MSYCYILTTYYTAPAYKGAKRKPHRRGASEV